MMRQIIRWLPFGVVTVADVAYPQSAYLEQSRNVILQRLF
jgi:hypothetical protein